MLTKTKAIKTLLIFMILCSFACSVFAISVNAEQDIGSEVNVYINNKAFLLRSPYFIDGITYVPIRAFAKAMDENSAIEWESENALAKVSTDGLSIKAYANYNYIEANGRCIGSDGKNILVDGVLLVPLRSMAKAFGASINWDSGLVSAFVTKGNEYITDGDSYYNQNDLHWLSRIINAEACSEPFMGKIAVGNVVLNRVNDSNYPNTIKEVIFQSYKDVYQFTPVKNGTVYNNPSEDSIIAAKICLDGYSISDELMYFIREDIATSTWVSDTRTFVMNIGHHDFYY